MVLFFRVRKELGRGLDLLAKRLFVINVEKNGPMQITLVNECAFYLNIQVR